MIFVTEENVIQIFHYCLFQVELQEPTWQQTTKTQQRALCIVSKTNWVTGTVTPFLRRVQEQPLLWSLQQPQALHEPFHPHLAWGPHQPL